MTAPGCRVENSTGGWGTYGSPPRYHQNPFTLGVASGDPRKDSVVLWTRLAPEPLQADGGMEPRPVEVRWEVAKDPGMRRLVRRGRASAWPAFAHSVHVEVDGLDDGREYFYRFTSGSAASPVGRTRTAPRGRVNQLTFSFTTCQKWDDGFYPAYREIAREDHDFVIHLGDYTYEYGIANGTGPRSPNPPEFASETQTLERYRLQHALYKTDPHLQAAHRAHPFIVIWDDHEVVNDYTGDPFWFSRRANGYRAFYGPMIRFNPHIRFFDGDRHGSMKARVSRGGIEVDWRIADRVGDPNAPVRTLRTFAVESGRPGVAQY